MSSVTPEKTQIVAVTLEEGRYEGKITAGKEGTLNTAKVKSFMTPRQLNSNAIFCAAEDNKNTRGWLS